MSKPVEPFEGRGIGSSRSEEATMNVNFPSNRPGAAASRFLSAKHQVMIGRAIAGYTEVKSVAMLL